MDRTSFRHLFVVGLIFVSFVACWGAVASAAAAQKTMDLTVSTPTMYDDAAEDRAPGTIIVAGRVFTPGGQVYLALYDQWGTELYETRWVAATQSFYGPNGSLDPALGYIEGGIVQEAFAGLCETVPMVRAHDDGTSAWSEMLDLAPGC